VGPLAERPVVDVAVLGGDPQAAAAPALDGDEADRAQGDDRGAPQPRPLPDLDPVGVDAQGEARAAGREPWGVRPRAPHRRGAPRAGPGPPPRRPVLALGLTDPPCLLPGPPGAAPGVPAVPATGPRPPAAGPGVRLGPRRRGYPAPLAER